MTREEPHHSPSPPLLAPASPASRKGSHSGGLYWAPATASPHGPPPPSADFCALGQPLKQTPVSRPHAQMELKAQLAPGLRKKSWNLSSQLHKQCFYTHNRLCNLSPWRASELKTRTTPHPPTTQPPCHSRCSFHSCRLCGLVHEGTGPARQWIQLHDECNPRSWFQWVYAGDLVKTTSERHWGQVPGYPWLRWGQEQCWPGSHESSHKAWNGTHRTLPEVNIPRGAIVSGFSPSRCAPIPPASTIDQKQSEETDLGALFHQPGSRLHPWQGSDNQRAMGNSPQYPGQARVKITAITPPIKG